MAGSAMSFLPLLGGYQAGSNVGISEGDGQVLPTDTGNARAKLETTTQDIVMEDSWSKVESTALNDGSKGIVMQPHLMANGASNDHKALARTVAITPDDVQASISTRLPKEILGRIIMWSMTATRGTVRLPGLTTAHYEPGINTSVLLLDRACYHEARKHLLRNIFVIGDYGSDLQRLTTAGSVTRCRIDGCPMAVPVFNSMVFEIGDTWANANFAEAKMHAFACALKYLRQPIRVNTLFIRFKEACFLSPDASAETILRWFSKCLVNINVSRFFVLQGLDIHLYLDIRRIARKLGMNFQPISSHFLPRYFRQHEDGHIQLVEGRYSCVYVPATTESEIKQQPGQTINDAKSIFSTYKETEPGIDVYPW